MDFYILPMIPTTHYLPHLGNAACAVMEVAKGQARAGAPKFGLGIMPKHPPF